MNPKLRDFIKRILTIGLLCCFAGLPPSVRAAWGDQRDGTYWNPILPGDDSDMGCIRVGDDFYAISFHYVYSDRATPSKDFQETK